jgi:hypothetical protein
MHIKILMVFLPLSGEGACILNTIKSAICKDARREIMFYLQLFLGLMLAFVVIIAVLIFFSAKAGAKKARR